MVTFCKYENAVVFKRYRKVSQRIRWYYLFFWKGPLRGDTDCVSNAFLWHQQPGLQPGLPKSVPGSVPCMAGGGKQESLFCSPKGTELIMTSHTSIIELGPSGPVWRVPKKHPGSTAMAMRVSGCTLAKLQCTAETRHAHMSVFYKAI